MPPFRLNSAESLPSPQPVVGGIDISTDQVPYFAILLRDKVYIVCGGSILNERKILTAAHCLKNSGDLYVMAGYNKQLMNLQVIHVKAAVIHSKFIQIVGDSSRPSTLDYDYAMLTLARNLKFTTTVQPIKLPNATDPLPPTGTTMMAMGVGATLPRKEFFNASRDSLLKCATLPIFDFKVCQFNYAMINIRLTERMFCAGYASGEMDVCNGDSGGPLMWNGTQYGLVSFGFGCAKPFFPSVYARVGPILPWIAEHSGAGGGGMGFRDGLLLIILCSIICLRK